MKNRKNQNACVIALTALALLFIGCEPKDKSLLNKGIKSEFTGRYAEAANFYAEAALLGNPDAYKKLGDLTLSQEFTKLFSTELEANINNKVAGFNYGAAFDNKLADAKNILARVRDLFEKAKAAGCTNQLESSISKLESCTKKVEEIELKVCEAKEQERLRLEEEKREREAKEWLAKEQERIRMEEEKRRQEEVAREVARKEAEERKRNSPEYCIENSLELSPAAFREVVREIHYVADTGNKYTNAEENEKHRGRFRNATIIVRGKIRKVESTFFTDKVKCVIDAHGQSISARFDSMLPSEARLLRCGDTVLLEGRISNRPVLSDIAMDHCELK